MQARNRKILVVDDEDFNQKVLVRLLDRFGGYEVSIANTGTQALEKLDSEAFDAILLDITMPGLDGYEVLKLIKARDSLRDLPVIMTTGVEDKSSVIRCIELGAEDYLCKPIDPILLKARLGACIEKKVLRDKQTDYLSQIQAEKKRVDQLLNTILPKSAVAELKATGKVPPRRYNNVAVLFCDIVSFTQFCENRHAEEVVNGLQSLFESFEQITHRYGLEKIKTIGDEFMLTANLTQPIKSPLLSTVACGLEMIRIAREFRQNWSVRVGIDFGPVVAGIVGRDKYQFDLWGDTVNTASRMANIARANTLILPARAWREVEDSCIGRSLGPVDVKGKQSIDVVEIGGLKSHLTPDYIIGAAENLNVA